MLSFVTRVSQSSGFEDECERRRRIPFEDPSHLYLRNETVRIQNDITNHSIMILNYTYHDGDCAKPSETLPDNPRTVLDTRRAKSSHYHLGRLLRSGLSPELLVAKPILTSERTVPQSGVQIFRRHQISLQSRKIYASACGEFASSDTCSSSRSVTCY